MDRIHGYKIYTCYNHSNRWFFNSIYKTRKGAKNRARQIKEIDSNFSIKLVSYGSIYQPLKEEILY